MVQHFDEGFLFKAGVSSNNIAKIHGSWLKLVNKERWWFPLNSTSWFGGDATYWIRSELDPVSTSIGTSQFTRRSRVQTGDLFLRAESSDLQSNRVPCGQISSLGFPLGCVYTVKVLPGPSLIQESVQSSQIVLCPGLDDRSCSQLFSCVLLRFQDSWSFHPRSLNQQAWTKQRTVLLQWVVTVSCQLIQAIVCSNFQLLRKTETVSCDDWWQEFKFEDVHRPWSPQSSSLSEGWGGILT